MARFVCHIRAISVFGIFSGGAPLTQSDGALSEVQGSRWTNTVPAEENRAELPQTARNQHAAPLNLLNKLRKQKQSNPQINVVVRIYRNLAPIPFPSLVCVLVQHSSGSSFVATSIARGHMTAPRQQK
jgi:hypothetical protein